MCDSFQHILLVEQQEFQFHARYLIVALDNQFHPIQSHPRYSHPNYSIVLAHGEVSISFRFGLRIAIVITSSKIIKKEKQFYKPLSGALFRNFNRAISFRTSCRSYSSCIILFSITISTGCVSCWLEDKSCSPKRAMYLLKRKQTEFSEINSNSMVNYKSLLIQCALVSTYLWVIKDPAQLNSNSEENGKKNRQPRAVIHGYFPKNNNDL